MKNIVLLVVFVLGLVFMQFVQGQTVDEVINKYIDARGGKEKITSLQSVYMEGIRPVMGTDVPIKVTIVQGKLYRTDFEFGGSTGYTIITPSQGWSYVPMRSDKIDAIPADRLKTMQGQLDISGPLIDYAAKGNKVELQGKETIDGKEAYKIKVTPTEGKEMFYYIDTKTNLVIQTKQTTPGLNGKDTEVITNFSDYKMIDGLMFPQTISNPGTGMAGGTTTFDKIEINKKVDDSQFKPSK